MIQQDINPRVQLYADESGCILRIFKDVTRKGGYMDVPVQNPRIPHSVAAFVSERDSWDLLKTLSSYFAARKKCSVI